MNHNNYTNSCIQESGMFAVSILTEETDPGLIGTFGFQSGKDNDKFNGVSYQEVEGMPIVNDACGYLVCKVIDKMETSTHTVFLGEVVAADNLKKEPAMTYSYYHKVVKGKSPKNAPTYIPEEEKKAGKWVCGICGYEYDGEVPFEELPDDFVCPLCKQPKSVFRYKE
jgi:flavin reductase (DIM6/NTAB) family NADH-FMN oxidoreductase RutF/rubredoxin